MKRCHFLFLNFVLVAGRFEWYSQTMGVLQLFLFLNTSVATNWMAASFTWEISMGCFKSCSGDQRFSFSSPSFILLAYVFLNNILSFAPSFCSCSRFSWFTLYHTLTLKHPFLCNQRTECPASLLFGRSCDWIWLMSCDQKWHVSLLGYSIQWAVEILLS